MEKCFIDPLIPNLYEAEKLKYYKINWIFNGEVIIISIIFKKCSNIII